MSDGLEVLEEWAGALLAKLEPGERRKLLGQVARDLRRNQQSRIAGRKAPDGTAYAPCKRSRKKLRRKVGRIKGQMFRKLRTARFMRAETSAERVAAGFIGRVGRIARTHQFGVKNGEHGGAPALQYPKRALLGLSNREAQTNFELLIRYLTSDRTD